ncbi:MAG: polyphenol oxidase [Rhodospirillaceae bacterium]|nr:polyphenol oxidase [Rhodospirillaceae bacterium]
MIAKTRVKPIISSLLKATTNVRHGFYTRQGGVSKGIYSGLNCGQSSNDSPKSVKENRRLVAADISGDSQNFLNTLHQVHGPNIVYFPKDSEESKSFQADGAVSNKPGQILSILTADCAPVLFADVSSSVIGACHAGWRGALNGIIENTVISMERLNATRDKIIAIIGPCIGQKSYEVGSEFFDMFFARNNRNSRFFKCGPNNRYSFDLSGFILEKLRDSGVTSIDVISADTFTDKNRFFSYRRSKLNGENDYGRMISAIFLEPPP